MQEMNKLLSNLDTLKLSKIKELLPNNLVNSNLDYTNVVKLLTILTDEEIRQRDERARQINVAISHFPYLKTIDMFDFNFQPSINRNKIMELLRLDFISNCKNVVFQGLPGTGKTMLSICIGIEAASNRYSTYFISCNALLNNLKTAKYENKLDARIKHFCKYKLLIIDEFGFLPLNKDDANLLFQLIAARYEKRSTIITTNVPFSKWGESLNDPIIATAILDRLLDDAFIFEIDGPSYRLRKLGV